MEYNQELSFDGKTSMDNFHVSDCVEAVRICCFTQAMAEGLGWRFQPWIQPIIDRELNIYIFFSSDKVQAIGMSSPRIMMRSVLTQLSKPFTKIANRSVRTLRMHWNYLRRSRSVKVTFKI
jgi:hypothetical protein